MANKMRCTFCHRASGGYRVSTTGCTAVFLFQAHHTLARKPVLPETKHELEVGRHGEDFGWLVVSLSSFLQQPKNSIISIINKEISLYLGCIS